MSTRRQSPSASQVPLKKGAGGRNLCRWCSTECSKARQTFCSPLCVFEWKLRTQPSFLREAVWLRDMGICAQCGMDTVVRMREIRKEIDAFTRGSSEFKAKLKVLGVPTNRFLSKNGYWDTDHKLAVEHGGGECGLFGVQTLCFWCHKAKTAEQRRLKA